MRRKQPESQLQRSILQHLSVRGYRAIHVPNGSKLAGVTREQRARAGARLKADGVCAGFPDLIVFGPDRIGFVEVKIEGEYASENQMEVEDWLTGWGHLYAVCRSLDDVDETLAKWGWTRHEQAQNSLPQTSTDGVSGFLPKNEGAA